MGSEKISSEFWREACTDFETNKSLLTNIKNHLVPIVLQKINEKELLDIVYDHFHKCSVLEKPIRYSIQETPDLEYTFEGSFISGKRVYYFDNKEILQVTDNIQRFENESLYKPNFYTTYAPILIKKWELATHYFRSGMSFRECLHIFWEISDKDGRSFLPPRWSDFERLVQKVEKPEYERYPENLNCCTFDRIRVSVHLSKYIYKTHDELKNAVKAYQKYIAELALSKIKQDSEFFEVWNIA